MFVCSSVEAMRASKNRMFSSYLLRSCIKFVTIWGDFSTVSQIQAWNFSLLLIYWSGKIKPILPLLLHSSQDHLLASLPLHLVLLDACPLVHISDPLIGDDLFDASFCSQISHTVPIAGAQLAYFEWMNKCILPESIGENKMQRTKRLLALVLAEKYMKAGFNQ